LNEIGQTQLARRPSIIPAIFSLFTSERHLKVLIDKENAVLIGTAIDELIRHHPTLKAPVFEALKSTLSRIEELGKAYVVPSDILHWYRLTPIPASSESDAAMDVDEEEEAPESKETSETPAPIVGTEEEQTTEEENPSKSHDNIIVSYFDVLGRVSHSVPFKFAYA
jgi:E3 ubiquitin-protein ligase HUWE1